MAKKIIFTEEQEKEIIEFYLTPNSLRETCRHFKVKNKNVIKKVLEKHGIQLHSQEVCMQLKQQKATKTNLERYGVTNTYQIPEVVAKAQRVWKENEPEIRKKMQQTSLERYGDPNYHNDEKIKQTRLEKYGVENFFQNKEIHKKALLGHRYKYKNIKFDSFPELCFYLYCINKNISISREMIKLPFIFNGKQCYYYPDFKVNEQLIEIKGNQFLTEDGSWKNPYNHNLNDYNKARYECAIKNNVKIIYTDEYQKYIDWFYANNYKKEDFLIKCDD